MSDVKTLGIRLDGVRRDSKSPIVSELHEAAVAYGDTRTATKPVTVQDILGQTENAPVVTDEDVDRDPETFLLADLFRAGSSKNVLVRERGLEPPRSCEH